jgi:hypothetical protein
MLRPLFLALLVLTPAAGQGFGRLTREFLELTEAQDVRLREIVEPFYRWGETQRERIRQVEAEIEEEARKTPPDPMALGVRFAELESIRRHSVERLAEVIRLRRSVLTPEQLRRVQLLEQAARLSDTVRDANCEFVMLPDDLNGACGVASVNLRTPLPSPGSVIPTIVDPSVPFDPTAPLRRYLELTPQQSAAYLRNLDLLRTREAAAGSRLACSDEEANRALAASPLSPADIGFPKANAINAYRLIQSLYEEAISENVALLTPSQWQRLELLEQVQMLTVPADLARRFALLPPVRIPAAGFVFFSGIPFGASLYFCRMPL